MFEKKLKIKKLGLFSSRNPRGFVWDTTLIVTTLMQSHFVLYSELICRLILFLIRLKTAFSFFSFEALSRDDNPSGLTAEFMQQIVWNMMLSDNRFKESFKSYLRYLFISKMKDPRN